MPWSRAAAGLPTGVIGTAASLEPPPEGTRVITARCGPALDGLVQLGAAVASPHPVELLLAPVHHRLARDVLPIVGPPEVPALPADTVLVLEGLERCEPDATAVIRRWIGSHHALPLILVARGPHPLLDALEKAHGAAAVLRGEPTPTHLSREVVALALSLEQGPVTLASLASALGQTELSVRAALVQAQLSGIELGLDEQALSLDPAVCSAVLATAANKPSASSDPADRARRATAIGAWKHALDLYAQLPALALEAAALHWAQGELEQAEAWAGRAPEGVDRDRALTALAWDAHLPDTELHTRIARLPEPERALAEAAALARSGDFTQATDKLMNLTEAEGEAAIDALHLLAKLPLMGPGSLVVARRFAGEAFKKLDESDLGGRARLRETNARLTLRARNVREAARLFEQALPLLEAAHQQIPFARAVAGLAASIDLVGSTDSVLDWLDRAMRLNRDQPHGLSWCHAALDTLMDRIEIDDGHTLSALQRRSLELATIRAGQGDPTPLETL